MPKTPEIIANHPQAWLLKPIYARLHFQNKMFSVCIVGEPGCGKSYSAMAWADILDRATDGSPRFSIERVCFSAGQFAEVIAKDWPKGTAIIMDDAGLNLYSREAMSKTVRQIAKVFQSCRYKNFLIFLTLPSLALLDKTVRTLLNAYVEPVEIVADIEKVRAKFHFIQTNPKTGKTYFKRPEKFVYVTHPDGARLLTVTQLDNVLIDKPPMELVAEYEKRKKAYLDDWYEKNVEKIKAIEKGKAPVFERYYNMILAEVKRYTIIDKGKEKVDATKILAFHPEIGRVQSYLIARIINNGIREGYP